MLPPHDPLVGTTLPSSYKARSRLPIKLTEVQPSLASVFQILRNFQSLEHSANVPSSSSSLHKLPAERRRLDSLQAAHPDNPTANIFAAGCPADSDFKDIDSQRKVDPYKHNIPLEPSSCVRSAWTESHGNKEKASQMVVDSTGSPTRPPLPPSGPVSRDQDIALDDGRTKVRRPGAPRIGVDADPATFEENNSTNQVRSQPPGECTTRR
jgi:hypothetical protein